MNLSFKEKSIWATFISVLVIFGYYFVTVIQMSIRVSVSGADIGYLLLTVIILLAVVLVAFHIVLAIASKPEPEDERDLLIEAKSNGAANLLLGMGVCFTIAALIISELWGGRFMQDLARPFMMAHILLFSLFISEIVKLATQLFYYRRGV